MSTVELRPADISYCTLVTSWSQFLKITMMLYITDICISLKNPVLAWSHFKETNEICVNVRESPKETHCSGFLVSLSIISLMHAHTGHFPLNGSTLFRFSKGAGNTSKNAAMCQERQERRNLSARIKLM